MKCQTVLSWFKYYTHMQTVHQRSHFTVVNYICCILDTLRPLPAIPDAPPRMYIHPLIYIDVLDAVGEFTNEIDPESLSLEHLIGAGIFIFIWCRRRKLIFWELVILFTIWCVVLNTCCRRIWSCLSSKINITRWKNDFSCGKIFKGS